MHKPPSYPGPRRPWPQALAALLAIAPTGAPCAATANWAGPGFGASALWSDAGNWSPQTPPADGDALVFNGALATDYYADNDLQNLQVSGITLGATGGAAARFTLSGNAITSDGNISAAGPAQAIALDVSLGASQTWDGGSGGGLQVSGAVALAGHSLTLENRVSIDNSAYDTRVGAAGPNSLTLQAGASLISNNGLLAVGGGEQGAVVISGGGSAWTTVGDLGVGQAGAGSLTVQNGGTMNSYSSATLGGEATGVGAATVDGAGSHWQAYGPLTVGGAGVGTLNIQNQGTASLDGSAFLTLGDQAGGHGSASVDGAGSRLAGVNVLTVGNFGDGSLTVQNGASLDNNQAYLGYGVGSHGTAGVSGSGSAWTNNGNLSIGLFGEGGLSIQNHGQVSNWDAALGQYAGASGAATNGTEP